MTFDEAVLDVQRLFRGVRFGEPEQRQTLMSGGRLVAGDMPALYATPGLAAAAWRDAFKAYAASLKAAKTTTLIWESQPTMEEFSITIQDKHGTHRFSGLRYAVRSVFGVEAAQKVAA